MKMCLTYIMLSIATVLLSALPGFYATDGSGAGGGLEIAQYDCGGVAPRAGDLNGDCKVDYSDLAIILQNWLLEGTAA